MTAAQLVEWIARNKATVQDVCILTNTSYPGYRKWIKLDKVPFVVSQYLAMLDEDPRGIERAIAEGIEHDDEIIIKAASDRRVIMRKPQSCEKY